MPGRDSEMFRVSVSGSQSNKEVHLYKVTCQHLLRMFPISARLCPFVCLGFICQSFPKEDPEDFTHTGYLPTQYESDMSFWHLPVSSNDVTCSMGWHEQVMKSSKGLKENMCSNRSKL